MVTKTIQEQSPVKTDGVLQVEATDANTCKAIDSINVGEREVPTVDLGPDSTYCTEGKVIIGSQLSYQNCSFLWSTADTDETIVIMVSGTYWLRVTNEYGCAGSWVLALIIHLALPF